MFHITHDNQIQLDLTIDDHMVHILMYMYNKKAFSYNYYYAAYLTDQLIVRT